MRYFIVLCLLLAAVNCHAIEPDKQKHYVVSVPFGVLGGVIIESCCSEWPWYYKVPSATLIGILPGLGKELMDEINYGGWDNQDLLADTLGSLTGVGISYTWRW